jgi:hypothetical protein
MGISIVIKLVARLSNFAKSPTAFLIESLGWTYLIPIMILECSNTFEMVDKS